jgi:hypothetical protein
MSNQPNPNVFFRGKDMGIGNFPIKGGTINDGGPAFPMPPVGTGDPRDGMTCGSCGMTLRDYFAAAALQGNIAHPEVTGNRDDIAMDAYKYADAMLKARREK